MSEATPTIVYLGPGEHLPAGRPSYIVIERHTDGIFAATGHGFDKDGNWEIYASDHLTLDQEITSATDWALTHGIDTIHVVMDVEGWDYG